MAACRTVLRMHLSMGVRRVLCCERLRDFSKVQYGSLKMILGSKHVGAILSVLV